MIRSDFARIDVVWPDDSAQPYRFMNTADWPDKASFERGFYDDTVQASLQENWKMLKEPVFLISEIVIHETKEPEKSGTG